MLATQLMRYRVDDVRAEPLRASAIMPDADTIVLYAQDSVTRWADVEHDAHFAWNIHAISMLAGISDEFRYKMAKAEAWESGRSKSSTRTVIVRQSLSSVMIVRSDSPSSLRKMPGLTLS